MTAWTKMVTALVSTLMFLASVSASQQVSGRSLLQALKPCPFRKGTVPSGSVATDNFGSCTCNNGIYEKCSCFNFDRTLAKTGGFVFKVDEACRCTFVGLPNLLVNVTSGCVPLRSNILSVAFRNATIGSDWGVNFDAAVPQALNAGNSLAVLETGNSLSYNIAKPCSFAPHWHPRASETYILPALAKGASLITLFSDESAPKITIQNMAGPGVSIIPRGLLHNLINPNCYDVPFFASYNSNDQGRSDVPGLDCAKPPTGPDGPSQLILYSCQIVEACKGRCAQQG